MKQNYWNFPQLLVDQVWNYELHNVKKIKVEKKSKNVEIILTECQQG